MSNIVLYHTVNKSLNPLSGEYYDPWSNHIWLCIEQIRKWNPTIPIFMITDDIEVAQKQNFEKYAVIREFVGKLTTTYDIDSLPYYNNDNNPMSRSSGIRTFYIEEVMKKNNLSDVFTFDNDVLVYCDLEKIGTILSSLIERTAITPVSYQEMVFGMCYIKNTESLSIINKRIWKMINEKKNLSDMVMWHDIWKDSGISLVDILPIWIFEEFSALLTNIGGIFDPASIGQYLLGCHNGNPAGSLFPHHYIHNRLREGSYTFLKQKDDHDRIYISLYDNNTKKEYKILSIHVHNKKLKELM